MKDLYMKTRRKLLLIAGSISLALGIGGAMPAPAQTTSGDLQSPAAATQPATPSNKSNLSVAFDEKRITSSARDFDITFREFSSYDQAIKLFPELRQTIEQYGINAGFPDILPQGAIAKVSDSLYLFRSENTPECGAAGCPTVAFSLHEEFYPSAYILSPLPPSRARIDENGEPSIFTCNRHGENYEWKRRNDIEMTPERQPIDCASPEVLPTETSPQEQSSPKP